MKVLIANRGAIARRILRTARRLGWKSVVVYSEADAESPAVREADEAVLLGPPPAASSYLDGTKILHAARQTGAEIIHPGYGFLSENPDFAEACEAEGFRFAGPTPSQIRLFGLKNTARDAARRSGVPLLPGTDLLETEAEALAAAESLGFPVMLKSAAGGGGIGMQVCRNDGELRSAYASVRRLGEANFRHGGVFLEKFVPRARHIEVQLFGDGHGRVLALGERDCSAQRRNQKVVEECPAPGLPESVREQLHASAVRLGEAVGYRSAGTVEFLYDADAHQFYFLEVNTRLQVEHGVTEEVYRVDSVEWMLRLAAGETLFLNDWQPQPRGHAIQVRLYAEIPAKQFQPSTGLVTHVSLPDELRVECWLEPGVEVTSYYDPMLAKLIAFGATREEARQRLLDGLKQTRVDGLETNARYLQAIVESEPFRKGQVVTAFLRDFCYDPALVEVVEGGVETLVVDWPGRLGYWDVGVPPSGPFDERSFRSANRALGNEEGAAGLEFTARGPTLRFLSPAWCCLAGAEFGADLEGQPVPVGRPFLMAAGQTLRIGTAKGPGVRGYLAVRGGWDVSAYLGSCTTFRLGQFGGHGGRALRAGDFLRLFPSAAEAPPTGEPAVDGRDWSHEWEVGVSYGPHGAPDFFTEAAIEQFFATAWEVHYNSARTGVRLIGPKPEWARPDGGEAGLHPSNIHDNAYQVGAVDFTGDMPIILGPDGPSLGGFVCPATVLTTELWKVGQARPGDRIRFVPLALDAATQVSASADYAPGVLIRREPPIVWQEGDVVVRRQGDTGFLVEFGPMVLDLALRFRVQALYEALRASRPEGMLELTPGVRSLQVRFEASRLSSRACLEKVTATLAGLPAFGDMKCPTRTIWLPLSWDDPATQLAIQKYMQSVRPGAPWCPSNLEFIRRINGLASVEEVKRIVFEAAYLVLGLGDVYLGAPVATPLDPRHRLVTTKYNPARTWTPENAVGIGGAYLCIYGMEGPGGYQFVGRTVPIWNRYRVTRSFQPGTPWLLRFFDQIRFYEVGADELMELRRDILTGRFEPRIDLGEFCFADYQRFLQREQGSIAAFQERQRQAFAEERERWRLAGQQEISEEVPAVVGSEDTLEKGEIAVSSPTAGCLWKVLVRVGDFVEAGQTVAVLESMKMEISCSSPVSGRVTRVFVGEGQPVAPGQNVLAVRP